MTVFLLALKRLLRKRGFAALLLLFPLCMAGVTLLLPRESAAFPPAGVFCSGAQPKALAFARQLCAGSDDFIFIEEEADLRQGVARGELDCGFLFSPHAEAVFSGQTADPSFLMLTSPVSLRAEVFRQRFASALISQISPHLCASLLQKYGIQATAEELSQLFARHAAQANRFHIELEAVSGAPLEIDAAAWAGRSFLLGVVSLFLFSCAAACAPLYSLSQLRALQLMARPKALWRCVVLPGLAAQGGCMAASCALGYLLAALCGARFTGEECAAAFFYLLFLTGLTPFLAALFADGRKVIFFIPPVLCLSLFLCPILTDLSSRIPALGFAAALLAPNAFFSFIKWGWPWALLCAAFFILLGPAILRLRIYGLKKPLARFSKASSS